MARNGGTPWEREVCRRLSFWWTGDPNQSVFWRSATSGARATVRGRRGLRTAGGHGDIAATDAGAQPLTDLIMIECKKGYAKATLHDLLDRLPSHRSPFEDWALKAQEQSEAAGIPHWIIVARRKGKNPVVVMRQLLYNALVKGCGMTEMLLDGQACVTVRFRTKGNALCVRLVAMTLDDFLAAVIPDRIRKMAKAHKRNAS